MIMLFHCNYNGNYASVSIGAITGDERGDSLASGGIALDSVASGLFDFLKRDKSYDFMSFLSFFFDSHETQSRSMINAVVKTVAYVINQFSRH